MKKNYELRTRFEAPGVHAIYIASVTDNGRTLVRDHIGRIKATKNGWEVTAGRINFTKPTMAEALTEAKKRIKY